ncbi:MAG: hypothetical protein AAB250_00540, partial [Bdellovibrionota bacterium]
DRDHTFSRYRALPPQQQREALENLRAYQNLLEAAILDGVPLASKDHSLAWWALKNFGWRPPSDFFANLTPSDHLEIYDQSHRQVFRPLRLFDFFSYTIEELVTHQWYELFDHEGGSMDDLVERAKALLESTDHSTMLINGEPHWVEEKFSEHRNRINMSVRLAAPLRGFGNTVAGYIVGVNFHDSVING